MKQFNYSRRMSNFELIASVCRFRKLHPPEWRLFSNQNMIAIDDRNCLPSRPHAVRLHEVAAAA